MVDLIVCPSCKSYFEYSGRGRPRKYCTACSVFQRKLYKSRYDRKWRNKNGI